MNDAVSTTTLVTIVDDDESVRDALKGFMLSVGFDVASFSSAEDFLVSNFFDKTSCLIVDLHMSVMSGLDLQTRLNNHHSQIPMIFFTAHDDPLARAQALRNGAVEFLRKPFAGESLLDAIDVALGNRGNG